MGIDVTKVCRCNPRFVKRLPDELLEGLSIWRQGGHMMRVAVRDESNYLCIDMRVAFQRSLPFFQDQDARTLAHDKTISPPVIRARCLLRFFIACAHRS